jgi:hypothetical protein
VADGYEYHMEDSIGCSGGDPLSDSRDIADDLPSRSGMVHSIVAWTWFAFLDPFISFHFISIFGRLALFRKKCAKKQGVSPPSYILETETFISFR